MRHEPERKGPGARRPSLSPTVALVLVLSALALAAWSTDIHAFLSGPPLVSTDSDFQGPVRREKDGSLLIEGSPSRVSVASVPLRLQPHGRYYVELRAQGRPEVHVDLFAPGSPAGADQFILLRGRKEGVRAHILESGATPLASRLRIFFRGSSVRIREVRLWRIDPGYFRRRALLAAAALLALGVYLFPYRRRALAQAAVAAVVSLMVYLPLSIPSRYNVWDNLWYVPTSLSLLREGNIELSEYRDFGAGPGDYRIVAGKGGIYIFHPIGTPLVAAPLVLAGDFIYSNTAHVLDRSLEIASLVAKIVAALSVGLSYLLFLRLAGDWYRAAGLSAVFAFATSQMDLHAGGLWSHNLLLPFFFLALLGITTAQDRWVWWTALPLALGVLIRPDFAITVLVLTVYVWKVKRPACARFALLGGAVACLFVAFSRATYGGWLPPYYYQGRISFNHFFEALLGNLISPNRGFFIFTPIFLFSLYGIYLSFREVRQRPLYRYLALAALLHWVSLSLHQQWWAGWSFGARLFAPMLPAWMVLLVPVLERARQWGTRKRLLLASAGTVCLLWGLFVEIRAVTDWRVHEWSATPSVDVHPERVWDWSDMQVLRGLGGN